MDRKYNEIVGKNLKYYMMIRKKTRNDLANDLGIPYTSIRDYEKGVCLAKPDKMEKIASYLNVPVHKLTQDKNNPVIIDSIYNSDYSRLMSEAVVKMSNLNEEEIKYIIKTIDMITNDKQ